MAQDRGLVIRGLVLLTLIGGLVSFVLAIMFWRAPEPPPRRTVAPSASTLPSAPGWEIRYNAATTLARRGSANVPWPLIREMLDEDQQLRNFQVRQPDGSDSYDESMARAYMLSALKALTAWHEKQKAPPAIPPDLRSIYAQVDKLSESPVPELKSQAEKTRTMLLR